MNAKQLLWRLSVSHSRWRDRLRYLWKSPRVYANWWAMPLPKLGIDTVIHHRDGARYHVRGGTTDLSVIHEQAISNHGLDHIDPLRLACDGVPLRAGMDGRKACELAENAGLRGYPHGRVVDRPSVGSASSAIMRVS